jgi:dGTPase
MPAASPVLTPRSAPLRGASGAGAACAPEASRGRLHPEAPSPHRSCFQRDRDRIIHSSAFRRLKHKTQVFVEHEGDYYRTRLTHSLEVAQVARTIAGALGLNGELTEAVALAHDLGHTPFGHTGEDALGAAMDPYGGFDHNAQAIRIVTRLERHYAGFDGLNLTWETLEGIAKHNGPVRPGGGDGPMRPGGDDCPISRGVPWALAEYDAVHDLELGTHAGAEAQVAALSDDVAYTNHDLHDGLRAGLFDEEEAAGLPLLAPAYAEVDALHPGLDPKRRRHEALRRVFGAMVSDVIATSRARLAAIGASSPDDVRRAGRPVVAFSDALGADIEGVRAFLFERMYRAPSVMDMRARTAEVVADLFPLYMARPDLLPRDWADDVAAADGEAELARIVADYVSGMTDRFALKEWQRLVG